MERVLLHEGYSVRFPGHYTDVLSLDQEYCIITDENTNQSSTVKFHEYEKIFSIPGLYESICQDRLECFSPEKVCGLLRGALAGSPLDVSDLCVLDLGAGNGMVGEQLCRIGVETVYGIDIRKEAKEAAERDRPGVYKGYYVADLTQIGGSLYQKLCKKRFNGMTAVSTLGLDDMSPLAFAAGFNLLAGPAWVAFNIKDVFRSDEDPSGLFRLFKSMIGTGVLYIHAQERYQHRMSIQDEPLYYQAIVGEKTADIPREWLSAR
jgi:predicted TPR repeat methyltransferase